MKAASDNRPKRMTFSQGSLWATLKIGQAACSMSATTTTARNATTKIEEWLRPVIQSERRSNSLRQTICARTVRLVESFVGSFAEDAMAAP